MWEWDYTPSSKQHGTKPLTRSQIKKLQQAYEKAGEISETVKYLEEQEQEKVKDEIENNLKLFF